MFKCLASVRRLIAASSLTAALLAACGGGGSNGTAGDPPAPPPPPTTGIRGDGVTSGPIAGFGSIFVNGIEFDTSTADFIIDGMAGSEADLSVGQIVTVTGSFNDDGRSGTADTVSFDDNVEGPISSLDLAAGTFLVLGQNVVVDAATSFDDGIVPPDLTGLTVGDVVEVSGYAAAGGGVTATRIERKPAGGEFEVTGQVSNLDSGGFTFSINALAVDFGSAMLVDFPTGGPAEGDQVEVKGSAFGPAGELLATRVERRDPGITAASGDLGEIEGLITRFASSSDFDVSYTPVRTSAQTVFENGTAADLALDVKVEVEGSFDSGGVLNADKVSIRRGNELRLTANADSVSVTDSTVTVFGVTVQTDHTTRFEDKSSADQRPFFLDDINPGDYLMIRGSADPTGNAQVLASRVEREDPDSEVEIQGFAESVNAPGFEILGVMIVTDGGTEFRDDNGAVIDASEFFAEAPDRLVKAEGQANGAVLTAEQVEFEIE